MFGASKNKIWLYRVLYHTQSIAINFFLINHSLPGLPVIFCAEDIGFKIAPAIIIANYKDFAGIVTAGTNLWNPDTNRHARNFTPEVCPGFSGIFTQLNISIIGANPNNIFIFCRWFNAKDGIIIFGTGNIKR